MSKTPTYCCDVFEFRAPLLDDVEWITRACQDDEILRFTVVPRPYTTDHARSFVEDWAGEVRAWAIIDGESSEGVGMIGVHHVVDGTASIGYWIAPWARRRGAAAAAVRFVCEELSTWSDVTVVTATIASTNVASQAVVRGVGFVESTSGTTERCPDGLGVVDAVVLERRLRP